MAAEAVISDAETNRIIVIFDVTPTQQKNAGIEVRHGAGVSTMVGPRLPRRLQYSATLYTPGNFDEVRIAEIRNESVRAVRPYAMLRRIEDALLGRLVYIDSPVQPHPQVEWRIEFVNASIGESDGENVIHVEIAAIEEFDFDAAFEVTTIRIPVPPAGTADSTADGEEGDGEFSIHGMTIGQGGSCQAVENTSFAIGGTIGTTLGATQRALVGDDENPGLIRNTAGAAAAVGRFFGGVVRSNYQSVKEGIGVTGKYVFGNDPDSEQTFGQGFEQGLRIGREGRGACRT